MRTVDLVLLLSMLVCQFVAIPCLQHLVCQFGWYISLSLDPHTATTIASGGLLIWFLSLSLPPVISSSIYLSFSPTMVINDGLLCGRAKSTLTKKWVKGWRRLERKKKIKWRNKYWAWCKCKFAKVVKIRFLD